MIVVVGVLMFATINANFSTLIANYRMHNKMPAFMNDYLELLKKQNPKATQCCMQLSHAMNAAGMAIPKIVKPGRRIGDNPVIPGGNGYYLLSVDEVEDFLTMRYLKTDVYNGLQSGMDGLKIKIVGREGILVFRDNSLGYHTELWTGKQLYQSTISGNMSEEGVFATPRVLFWEVTSGGANRSLPPWL